MTRSSGVTLRIQTTADIAAEAGEDFFVKGKGTAIDNSTEKTIAQSIKTLGKVYSIVSAADKRYGSKSMWHWEFTLR